MEGRERYPVNVRYARDFREDLPALERVLVKAPDGAVCRWVNWRTSRSRQGPAMIRDENAQLAGYVYVDTADTRHGRLRGCARRPRSRERHAAARAITLALDRPVPVPGARARAAEAARARSCSCIIFMLLYMTFHSLSEAAIVMLSVVYAMTGGVIRSGCSATTSPSRCGSATSRSTASRCRPASSWWCTSTRRWTRRLARGRRDASRRLGGDHRRLGAALEAEADDRGVVDACRCCRSCGARAWGRT